MPETPPPVPPSVPDTDPAGGAVPPAEWWSAVVPVSKTDALPAVRLQLISEARLAGRAVADDAPLRSRLLSGEHPMLLAEVPVAPDRGGMSVEDVAVAVFARELEAAGVGVTDVRRATAVVAEAGLLAGTLPAVAPADEFRFYRSSLVGDAARSVLRGALAADADLDAVAARVGRAVVAHLRSALERAWVADALTAAAKDHDTDRMECSDHDGVCCPSESDPHHGMRSGEVYHHSAVAVVAAFLNVAAGER